MAMLKTETITERIESVVKEGSKEMAKQERRSIANRIEVMIRDYGGRNGIAIPEQGYFFHDREKSGSDRKIPQ
jgi:hypothetical protein